VARPVDFIPHHWGGKENNLHAFSWKNVLAQYGSNFSLFLGPVIQSVICRSLYPGNDGLPVCDFLTVTAIVTSKTDGDCLADALPKKALAFRRISSPSNCSTSEFRAASVKPENPAAVR
jgi:hypothetical protein